ncbi:MAG: rRNA pseudouridine synthase [Bdellovibrionaceae bacterium]|nr:rRNA pseudouridine synthase [Pseudobdellovibrionaceae bacterium]
MPQNPSSATIRLNKLIAQSGLASRRGADQLIQEGHVTVNGKKVFELGVQVDPKKDRILVDGKPIRMATQFFYFAFHKPKGVLCTLSAPHGRPTVADFLRRLNVRLFPVGRLDWDSEGLLLLTNDGDFANKVTHPREEVTKTYLVKLNGQPRPEQIEKLRRGVTIIGGRVAAKYIERVRRRDGSSQYDWYKIVITEGKNRQVRQMFAKIGFDVQKLQRIAIGRLKLGSLPKGQLRQLHPEELHKIFQPDLPNRSKGSNSRRLKRQI